MKLAPVLIFTYKRVKHLQLTIDALRNNLFADKTELYIFSDGYRKDKNEVEDVRNYLKSLDSGFLNINIIEREVNYGLKKNIIQGIQEIFQKHESVIVMEEDVLTSPYFLSYMNRMLYRYSNSDNVYHVNGWAHLSNTNDVTYLSTVMNCWGWATWKNKWEGIDFNTKNIMKQLTYRDIYRFNNGNKFNFWGQITRNHFKRFNTWAIFWYAHIFKQNGLCVTPKYSYTYNIGCDGTGENSGRTVLKQELNIDGHKMIEDLFEKEVHFDINRKDYKFYNLSVKDKFKLYSDIVLTVVVKTIKYKL